MTTAVTSAPGFRERNQWLREILADRIEVLVPDEGEASEMALLERADYDSREG
jgi:hypothetical protein